MSLKVLFSEKHQRFSHPVVTISPKLERLTLNRAAFSMLVEEFGKPSEYCQILWDEDNDSTIFWITLCDITSLGSRRLDVSSKSTRTCSISILIDSLGWDPSTDTSRYNMTYDKKLKAGMVDTKNPL
jgi:hypothetical protein